MLQKNLIEIVRYKIIIYCNLVERKRDQKRAKNWKRRLKRVKEKMYKKQKRKQKSAKKWKKKQQRN